MISLYFGGIRAADAWTLLRASLAPTASGARARRIRFEREITATHGGACVRLYGSCRGATTSVLRAAGVGQGDEVIVTGFTCSAVPVAVRAAGAEPVYADIDPMTLAITPETVRPCITPKTRGLIVQHTLGVPADIEALIRLAREHDLVVIEDCALALGAERAGRQVGTFGDAAVFSFELSKSVTTGWGGALVVHNAELALNVVTTYEKVPELPVARVWQRALQTAICAVLYAPALFSVGRYAVAALFKLGIFRVSSPAGEDEGRLDSHFVHRMPGPMAAVGAGAWRGLGERIARMRRAWNALREVAQRRGALLVGLPQAGDVAAAPRFSWLEENRATAERWFAKRGIELGRWFDAAVAPDPGERGVWIRYTRGACPNGEAIAAEIVNLPTLERLSDADAANMAAALDDYFALEEHDMSKP
ncbi:MAG: DegT/DnrJ/EryC1/StrS family aminotransferase [Gemmatimonadaceae bacterium]